MIENRPLLTVFTHATLILGVALVAFPLYVTLIASTLTLEEILSVPMPLVPVTSSCTTMRRCCRPATTFVAGFIGSPPMNLIRGRIAQGGAVLAADGELSVRLPEALPGFEGRNVLLGVRPEHFEPCDAGAAMIAPDIDFIELLGSDSLVYGHIGAGKGGAHVAARLHAALVARDGHLPLRFTRANTHLFDPETGKRFEA